MNSGTSYERLLSSGAGLCRTSLLQSMIIVNTPICRRPFAYLCLASIKSSFPINRAGRESRGPSNPTTHRLRWLMLDNLGVIAWQLARQFSSFNSCI